MRARVRPKTRVHHNTEIYTRKGQSGNAEVCIRTGRGEGASSVQNTEE